MLAEKLGRKLLSDRDLAGVLDQHGLILFTAGLVEGDGLAVWRGSQPERNAIEHRDGCGAVLREIEEAENGLMAERWADKENSSLDDLPTRPGAGTNQRDRSFVAALNRDAPDFRFGAFVLGVVDELSVERLQRGVSA